MDYDGKSKSAGKAHLSLEGGFLLPDKFPGPVAVHAGFPDGADPGTCQTFYLFQLFLPSGSDGCRMQAEAGIYVSRVFPCKVVHRLSGRAVYVRENHPGDTGPDRPFHCSAGIIPELFVIQVGMGICKNHFSNRYILQI